LTSDSSAYFTNCSAIETRDAREHPDDARNVPKVAPLVRKSLPKFLEKSPIVGSARAGKKPFTPRHNHQRDLVLGRTQGIQGIDHADAGKDLDNTAGSGDESGGAAPIIS
jgi:hypothetical protein